MKAFWTIGLLIVSNTFMTLAWYGHLKFAEWKWFSKLGLISIVLIFLPLHYLPRYSIPVHHLPAGHNR